MVARALLEQLPQHVVLLQTRPLSPSAASSLKPPPPSDIDPIPPSPLLPTPSISAIVALPFATAAHPPVAAVTSRAAAIVADTATHDRPPTDR